MGLSFFDRQLIDEAGRYGVKFQKILVAMLVFCLTETLISIISFTRIQSYSSDNNNDINNEPSQSMTSELGGQGVSLVIFLVLWTLGFLGSYRRHPKILLAYVILSSIWLIIWGIILALLLLMLILLIGFLMLLIKGAEGAVIQQHQGGGFPSASALTNLRSVSHLSNHLFKRMDYQFGNNGTIGNSTSGGFDNDASGAWVGLELGLGLGFFSLAISLASLILWIISIVFANRQRRHLLNHTSIETGIPMHIIPSSEEMHDHHASINHNDYGQPAPQAVYMVNPNTQYPGYQYPQPK